MPEWFSEVVVALIGLSGTVLVAYLGYRQWQRGRKDTARDEFSQARRRAYESLWKLVEEIHVKLRMDPSELSHLPDRMREVNSFVLQNDVFLADDDHELVDAYLVALGEMVSWARTQGDPATETLVNESMVLPREAVAFARALHLRDQIKERVRKALQEA